MRDRGKEDKGKLEITENFLRMRKLEEEVIL